MRNKFVVKKAGVRDPQSAKSVVSNEGKNDVKAAEPTVHKKSVKNK